MHSIGEMSRAGGLSVSALRFYDRAGVLVPAVVDPVTGYRWYADHQVPAVRLVAGLRRVGMPLAEIGAAVRHLSEPAAVRRLLAGHLRRLEDGLADARREFGRLHALIDALDPGEQHMSVTRLILSRTDLAGALDAVRFAVGTDPDLPVLAGVLVEVEPAGARLVTTDRYRMAVAGVAATVDGPAARVLAPVDFVDRLRDLLTDGTVGEVALTLAPGMISATVAGRTVDATPLPDDFPDYRRLLRRPDTAAPTRVTVDVAALRAALTDGSAPTLVRAEDGVRAEVTVLGVSPAGRLRVVGADDPADGDTVRVGVNAGYLVDALDAAGRGQLVLELDSPITPLAVRLPDDERVFSVLMPIRLS
ncbi:MerR family DNA-binding transcriptional regulator [Micromonospora echinofusca]|uniref:MerR family DNA-binding transcriptional regulator n=1 Tax=Micromonospora echinofusca TaxID=47858 RepID=A0ABS3W0J1_MICEH|nr:MerR family DNA-binding transcriptional regulator [Micromonospora echinofusca]MBO4210236.1 MerR family DNA-binding transcriptional regulator [Micromonospora echinofusca]